jgi:hypothetical protein
MAFPAQENFALSACVIWEIGEIDSPGVPRSLAQDTHPFLFRGRPRGIRVAYMASRKRGNKIAVCSWKTEVILHSNVL